MTRTKFIAEGSFGIVTILLAILWQLNVDIFRPERILTVMSSVSVAYMWIGRNLAERIEKYSVSDVLASGYVGNFLEPVLETLLEQKMLGPEKKLVVFIPAAIAQAENYRNLLAAKKDLSSTPEMLNTPKGTKHVEQITNQATKTTYYFDVPHTLSSLNAWIDHRLAKKSNLANQQQKTALGKRYVAAFRRATEQMLTEKNLYPFHVQIISSVDELV